MTTLGYRNRKPDNDSTGLLGIEDLRTGDWLGFGRTLGVFFVLSARIENSLFEYRILATCFQK